ncbi:SepM family pheromone-processing serine protease [Paenibacillus sp. SAFN-117]
MNDRLSDGIHFRIKITSVPRFCYMFTPSGGEIEQACLVYGKERIELADHTQGGASGWNRNDKLRRRGNSAVRWYLAPVLVGVIVFCLLYFIPLPYYIYKPGSAENVRPMIEIKQGGQPESGSFMLTTVGVSDSNLIGYLYAKWSDIHELRPKEEVHRKGETDREYNKRQEYNMTTSQSNAIQAAYKKAGVPYRIENTGVIVLQVLQNMPAYKILQAGDLIEDVDGHKAAAASELTAYLQSKAPGEEVRITFRRGTETRTETLKLAELPADEGTQDGKPRSGLGVTIGTLQEVKPEDEAKQVTVKAGNIGGPSAGLMFSLEIYNQFVEEDITKGYQIAGTGEIDSDGNVGVIGGIQFKVVAAHRQGADIFFAPEDLLPGPGEAFKPILNATIAQEQAEKLKTGMKIVPVKTMDDALEYLKSLPPKAEASGKTAYSEPMRKGA